MNDDVFEVLHRDHEEVRTLLAQLEDGPVGATPEQRKTLTEQMVMAESRHEAVEEQYFWPAVREQGERGEQVAATAVGQEQEAKQVLAQLDKLDPADADFVSLLTGFIADAREHIAYEEDNAWPLLRAGLSDEQARELGSKIAKAKESAPTRPHPHTPPNETVLTT